jgi:arylformamidase
MIRVAWHDLDRAALDAQLSPSRVAKDPWGVLGRHEAETAALAGAKGLLRKPDIAYAGGPRQVYDLTLPEGVDAAPCIAFIHGGFWQEGSKAGSGFAARAFAARGWAHAAIGYTLAPEARLGQIVDEIATALTHLLDHAQCHGIDPARMVLAGHSAGGHLAAAIACGLGGRELGQRIRGYLPMSGVFDLAPIAASYVNDAVRMTEAEAEALSPILRAPLGQVALVVGADEPEAFLRQTDALATAWKAPVIRARGRDHFDLLDELADPGSATFGTVLAMGEAA